jgi:hypothetical protein
MNDQTQTISTTLTGAASALAAELCIMPNERRRLFEQRLKEEPDSPERCLWMSFCDTDRPKGQQFLGVVITKAPGLAHAVDRLWALGINPGGQIMSYETDGADIQPEHFDRLLSKDELVAAGYCDT